MLFNAKQVIDNPDEHMIYYRVSVGKWQHDVAFKKHVHKRLSKDQIKNYILSSIFEHSKVTID